LKYSQAQTKKMLKVTSLSFTAAALSLMTASTSTTVIAESTECTLQCQNNGTCTKQWQTAARSSSNFIQVMACSCPEGFTGPLCEQEASSQEEELSCTLNCVNGGQCLWEWTSMDSGNYAFEKHMKCDCIEGFLGELCEEASATTTLNNNSTTTEMECNKDCGAHGECVIEWTSVARSSHQFTSNEVCKCDEGFEGDTCQYEKQSSPETPCAHTCHNGGKCVSKWETAPLANDAMIQVTGCECAPGFTGPSCEIEVSDDDDDKCHLDCLNGGQCVFTWMETGTHNTNYFNSVYLSSFMMCECPSGYMGLHCEYQVESCPDSTMCFNGGKCVQDTIDSSSFSCDCTDVPDREGSMCEQESKKQVEVCDYGHVGHGQSLFCVNGGSCDTAISQENSDTYHHGCQCPDGFFGHHCEFHLEDTMMVSRETTETTFSSSSTASTTSSLNGVEITLIVAFSVAGTAFVMALLSIRIFVGQHDTKRANKCESTSAVPTSVIGDLDADGSSTMKHQQQPTDSESSSSTDIQIV